MIAILNEQIEGDLTVGRHLTAGGDLKVRGDALIGHGLRVEGWLDAPNIKRPLMGVFPKYEDLEAAYPTPQKGWIAVVTGESDDPERSMGAVYGVREGKWLPVQSADGTTVQYAWPALDASGLRGELACLRTDLEALRDKAKELEAAQDHSGIESRLGVLEQEKDSGLLTAAEFSVLGEHDPACLRLRQGEHVKTVILPLARKGAAGLLEGCDWEWVNNMRSAYQDGPKAIEATIDTTVAEHADTLKQEQTSLSERIEALDLQTQQAAARLALLQDKQSASGTLPRFSGIQEGVPESAIRTGTSTGNGSTSQNCAVVYDTAADRFLLRVRAGLSYEYYLNWADASSMGLTRRAGDWAPTEGTAYWATEAPYGMYLYTESNVFGNPALTLVPGTQPQVCSCPKIQTLTQAEYDALLSPEADTLYFIQED